MDEAYSSPQKIAVAASIPLHFVARHAEFVCVGLSGVGCHSVVVTVPVCVWIGCEVHDG